MTLAKELFTPRTPQSSNAPRQRFQSRLRLRLRTKLGSFFLSDSADRYWRVDVRVSKRKGRYLKLEHQGMPGLLPVRDCRATADDYVPSPNRPRYHHISPAEWESFAELARSYESQPTDADSSQYQRARASLDRIIGEHLRSAH